MNQMKAWVELPRNFYFTYDIDGKVIEFDSFNGRGAALSTENRILRWIMRLKGMDFEFMDDLFDQDTSVATRDFLHCCLACIHSLSDEYLSPLDPNSQKANNLTGANAFKHFPNAMYVGDATHVSF